VIYTIALKRWTAQNIVIGGAAGALPPVVAWAAATGSLSVEPLLLFLIIFFWTPPHFWALAVRYKDDYAAADVPMLPVVATMRYTSIRILAYTVFVWFLTLVFAPVADMGAIYWVSAIVLGAVFTAFAVRLLQDPTPKRAMRLFSWSISYITLLFGAMALDVLVRFGL
jgi:protoheme IX farnesyltransferase